MCLLTPDSPDTYLYEYRSVLAVPEARGQRENVCARVTALNRVGGRESPEPAPAARTADKAPTRSEIIRHAEQRAVGGSSGMTQLPLVAEDLMSGGAGANTCATRSHLYPYEVPVALQLYLYG